MSTTTPTNVTSPRSPRARWSLITGVVAAILNIPFVPGFYLEVVLGFAAIGLGSFGIYDARHGMRGRAMSIIGIVLGLAALAAYAQSTFGLINP